MTNNEKALMLHEQWAGKFETVSKCAINTREDLALAYTPGVAEPCKVIAEDKEQAYKYTIKSNTVAVVSDGSAVMLTPFQSALIHRTPKRLLRRLSILHRDLVELILKIYLLQDVLK